MNVESPASARRSLSLAKSGQRHVDLASDLDQRRRIIHVEPHRDRHDRPEVVGHVLADLAVAARRPALEHPVAVDQRDREPVDLGLDDVLELGIADPLPSRGSCASAGSRPAAPRPSGRWPARASAGDGAPSRARHGLGADALGRRVGGDQLGVLGLDPAQLVEQRVVLLVADLGIVEDVVAVGVVVEDAAELGGALSRVVLSAPGRRSPLDLLAPRARSAAPGHSAGARSSPRGR